MILLEKPYVSDFLLQTASDKKWPVLETPFTRELAEKFPLYLTGEAEALERCANGEKLYACSENSLAWVQARLADTPAAAISRLMKDKGAMRRALEPLDPQFFYREIPAENLPAIDISGWPFPFVLKPATGFLSLGVYVINDEEDWKRACRDIEENFRPGDLPAAVLDGGRFIAEQLITGDEYAVDLYFDDAGEPVILNILKHSFASGKDVSDRLYMTSHDIISARYAQLTDWLGKANRFIGARNFPAHVELRIDGGTIRPIEFNPLRFAGLCCTEMAAFSFGLNTVQAWLEGLRPNFAKLLEGKKDKIFSLILLDKRPNLPPNAALDFNRLERDFKKILAWRPMTGTGLPLFGVLFTETPASDASELEHILHSDLAEYVTGK